MQRGGSTSPDEAYDISIDANGNTYTTGYFTGFATFGTTTLNTSGVTDIFITKLDSVGNYVWALKAGGSNADRALSIKADAIGNTYITGFFSGTATFGNQTITSAGGQDVFIAKYDNTGTIQWAKSAGGTGSDIGNAINIDNSGNVIVTGEFSGSSTFGSTTLSSLYNSIDVFTVKLDATGTFLWAKKGSASATDRGVDVACDASGNIYVTGQFTDTITFDVVHNSTLYNSIFIVKYNSSGQEQWFRLIGAGTLNIVSGIAVDNSSNVFVTGDFTGTVTFFGNPNTTLSNTYSNRIFVAKYDNSGTLLWSHADGSSNNITSKNLTIDAAGNPYIIGNFKCVLNDYADQYGQGTFNSVGYWDIFVSKYNSSGVWQWSRQCGGTDNDYGGGIAVNNVGDASIAGSFSKKIIFPYSTSFIGYNVDGLNFFNYYSSGTYCNDNDYHRYVSFNSAGGSSDIFIAKNFNLNKSTYDYYIRTGSGCDRPYLGVCINDWVVNGCKDSIKACGGAQLYAFPNTHNTYFTDYNPGPEFTYLWSTGETADHIYTTTSGNYTVKQTSADGCFISIDTVPVTINPIPQIPNISDDVVINTNASYPSAIYLCNDSTLLTGRGYDTNTYYWNGPTGTINDSIDMATKTGFYFFYVKNSLGCTNQSIIYVGIDTGHVHLVPELICLEDTDKNDSIELCNGHSFNMYVYDTVSNPNANGNCMPANVYWSISPFLSPINNFINCKTTYTPSLSGNYQITTMVVQPSNCGNDTTYATKILYINVHPLPVVPFDTLIISGNTAFCPGDSTLLIVTGTAANFVWNGPGINGITNDSLWVHQDGSYFVHSTLIVTDSFGCSAGDHAAAYQNIVFPPQPAATMNPPSGLICPNDSVQLTCSGIGSFLWQGPSGTVGGDTSIIHVTIPGSYYCILTDTNGCALVSNTVVVNLYATPYITASPSTILCLGDSLVITAIVSPGSVIQWQAPFTGSSTQQTVTGPGTYSCSVTACGIPTFAHIIITQPVVTAQITANGPVNFCGGDTVVLSGNNGATSYEWQPGANNQQLQDVYQSGTYTLTISDTNGCTDTATQVVTVFPQATAQFSFNNTCLHDTVVFNNTSAPSNANWTWSFGDTASLSSIQYPKHRYADTGTYSVSLLVATNDGCRDSISRNVTIYPVPVALFSAANVCDGTPVQFIDSSYINNDTISSWSWDWGDNTPLEINPDASHLYVSYGSYNVHLTVASNAGCMDSVTKTVVVYPTPTASVINNNVCFGDTTRFIDSSTTPVGTISLWRWNCGGGSPVDTVLNSSHLYTSTGMFTTSLLVENNFGCKDSTTNNTFVHALPSAKFTIANACEGTTFLFNDSSTIQSIDTIQFYQWNFGDGSAINTNQNCSHLYSGYGSNSVQLTTISTFGCMDSIVKPLVINPNPVLSFSAIDTVGCVPLCVTFLDSSSVPTANVASWLWSFGDATSDSIQSPTHCYIDSSSSISYTVTLTVTSDSGCVSVLSKNNYITTHPNPIADFTTSNVCDGTAAQFTYAVSIPAGDTIQTIIWNLGDGNLVNDIQSNAHLYDSAGSYQVQLNVVSSFGCTDSITKSIVVNPMPVVIFSASDTVGCIPVCVTFQNTSFVPNAAVASWLWSFGDASSDSSQNPTHCYVDSTSSLLYTISLTVISDSGCVSTLPKNNYITTHPNPIANFTTSNVCDGIPVQFAYDASIPAGDTIQIITWNYGDGNMVNNIQSNSHPYDSVRNYLVQLNVVSSYGCVDSIAKPVVVNPIPVVIFSANDTIGCAPVCVTFQNSSFVPNATVASWLWNFGDGSASSNSQDAFRCYTNVSSAAPVLFSPMLTVTSDSGCVVIQTKPNYITVFSNPVANFSVSPQTATVADPVITIINNSFNADTCKWNFTDGQTATTTNPSPHNYIDTGTYNIMLITNTQYGCIDTTYQTVIIEPDFMFYIPTAFSPNDDGLNDTFIGKGVFIKKFEMMIFDRWGNLIYQTENIEKPWDGKANFGKEQAQKDVYIYSIEVTDFRLSKHHYKGTVTLVR